MIFCVVCLFQGVEDESFDVVGQSEGEKEEKSIRGLDTIGIYGCRTFSNGWTRVWLARLQTYIEPHFIPLILPIQYISSIIYILFFFFAQEYIHLTRFLKLVLSMNSLG